MEKNLKIVLDPMRNDVNNDVVVDRDRVGWNGYELISEFPVQRAVTGVSLVTSWRLHTGSRPSSLG